MLKYTEIMDKRNSNPSQKYRLAAANIEKTSAGMQNEGAKVMRNKMTQTKKKKRKDVEQENFEIIHLPQKCEQKFVAHFDKIKPTLVQREVKKEKLMISCEELTSYFKDMFQPIFEAERERNREMIKQTLIEIGVDQIMKDREIWIQGQRDMQKDITELKNKKQPEPQIIYKERLIHDKSTQIIEEKIQTVPLTSSNIQLVFPKPSNFEKSGLKLNQSDSNESKLLLASNNSKNNSCKGSDTDVESEIHKVLPAENQTEKSQIEPIIEENIEMSPECGDKSNFNSCKEVSSQISLSSQLIPTPTTQNNMAQTFKNPPLSQSYFQPISNNLSFMQPSKLNFPAFQGNFCKTSEVKNQSI